MAGPSEVAAQYASQNRGRGTAQEREDVAVPLSRHRPIYGVYGSPTSKAQISFKFEVYPRSDVFFGYTETAFWLLGEESAPFADIKFEPEIFWRYDLPFAALDFVRISPFSHSSNGEDGLESRSYNEAYLEFVTEIDPEGVNFLWSNKFFNYYSMDENNRDLREYRHAYQTRMSFHVGLFQEDRFYWKGFLRRKERGPEQSDKVLWSGNEVGYRFPTPFGPDFSPQFFVQYYFGYMENWKRYDERQDVLRAGIMLR
jgi:outer membrane phospholipase A